MWVLIAVSVRKIDANNQKELRIHVGMWGICGPGGFMDLSCCCIEGRDDDAAVAS